jgi:glycosyltransferase involved in cell wall biosynthesis
VEDLPLSVVSWGSDLLREARRSTTSAGLARVALTRANIVVCDCLAVRDETRRIAQVPDEKIVLLPWGTDVEAFCPDGLPSPIRNEPGWRDATIVLHTRSFEPGYAVDVVLQAFAAAYEQNAALRLVLAGDGSQREDVVRRIDATGLRKVVRLIGRTDNRALPRWFRAADIYLTGSESDGSSVSLLEALATGLPCVVSDIPGNREWVTPEVNGWLAPVGAPAALAEALLQAAALSPPARTAMRKRNRGLAVERADWTVNVSRLLDAYDRVRSAG